MLRAAVIAAVLVSVAVWAQESSDDEPVAAETEAEETLDDDDYEDFDIDSQEDHTEDDEDVFTPTDVVSYSQSVQFPVDI